MDQLYDAVAFLAVACLCILGQASGCDFPEFMQTTNNTREWFGRITNQNNDFTLNIRVESNKMMVESKDDALVKPYEWVCLHKYGDKYLVAHEEAGQRTPKYVCTQFLLRGQHVVQFKTSLVSDDMDQTLCNDEQLHLDDWLVVDRGKVVMDQDACSLQGGFSLRIFDKVRNEGVCSGYEDNTRMESECLEGEGINFYFRQQRCVPDSLMMYKRQHAVCLTSWSDGLLSFMLMKHSRDDHMWIVRYPTNAPDSFIAYMFLDLVADTNRRISRTHNYLRLDTVRDPPRPVTSLCVDDSEGCEYWTDVCNPGHGRTLSCPRRCELCNSTRPAMCSFANRWRGHWQDGTHVGNLALSVDTGNFTLYGDTNEVFHCIRWDSPLSQSSERFTTTEMVVSEFNNGCRPRYSCAQFRQDNTSPVLFLRLSQSQLWPFTSTVQEPVDCSGFEYGSEYWDYSNKFRSKHFKMLYSRTKGRSTSVRCTIPNGFETSFVASFRNGQQCNCSLSETHSGTTLSLNISACPSSPLHDAYTCVESSNLFSSKETMVITKTSTAATELNCWIFSRHPQKSVSILEAGHCNENVRRRLRKDRLTPLAVLAQPRRLGQPGRSHTDVTTSRGRSLNPPSENSDISYTVLPDRNSSSVSWENRNRTTDRDNPESKGGKDTEEKGSDASPFVIIAAVLFFAIFQIPCLCK